MVNRFLTGVSGQREVGEEYEGGHGRTNHFFRDGLVMMHEGGELGVGIGEINPLIFDEAKMLHYLQMGAPGVFAFEPVPGFLGVHRLNLIPDPYIQGSVENSHSLGIGIIPVGQLSIPNADDVVVMSDADVELIPERIKSGDVRRICGVSDDGRGWWRCWSFRLSRLDEVTLDHGIDLGHHKDADHLLRPGLIVPAIEARDLGDGERSGCVGRGHVDLG